MSVRALDAPSDLPGLLVEAAGQPAGGCNISVLESWSFRRGAFSHKMAMSVNARGIFYEAGGMVISTKRRVCT